MKTRIVLVVVSFVLISAFSLVAQEQQKTEPEPQSTTVICTYPDDKEISVRFHSVEYNKKNEPPIGKPWTPEGVPVFLFTPTELMVGNSTIPTGAYSLYTIKNKASWTLIISRNVTQGTPYDEKQDVARVTMETGKLPSANKPYVVSLGHIAPKVCSLQIVYGDTGVWAEFKQK
ncbi:MAG TPA: DUF2911 domain-containing protein [Terriglobales bacterium]|nr:DUF2911 domain-containing protein [Terriglobales bacterium]